jgi:hypothetical protein
VGVDRGVPAVHAREVASAGAPRLLRPAQAVIIRGSGGLRKLRWAAPDIGKRGGLRVVYYSAAAELAFYMLYVYTKTEQGDLAPPQVRVLGRLVREEFK